MVHNILSLELFRRRDRVGCLAETVKSLSLYTHTQIHYIVSVRRCTGRCDRPRRRWSFGGNVQWCWIRIKLHLGRPVRIFHCLYWPSSVDGSSSTRRMAVPDINCPRTIAFFLGEPLTGIFLERFLVWVWWMILLRYGFVLYTCVCFLKTRRTKVIFLALYLRLLCFRFISQEKKHNYRQIMNYEFYLLTSIIITTFQVLNKIILC